MKIVLTEVDLEHHAIAQAQNGLRCHDARKIDLDFVAELERAAIS